MITDYARKQYKAPISFAPEVYETSSKTGSRIRILYLLTGPIENGARSFVGIKERNKEIDDSIAAK